MRSAAQVIVSHDRFFIDEVCSDCLHISGVARRLTQSHGNYTMWAQRRKEQQATSYTSSPLRGRRVHIIALFSSPFRENQLRGRLRSTSSRSLRGTDSSSSSRCPSQQHYLSTNEMYSCYVRYGGSSSAINKMLMKAKQAEKLEEGEKLL